MNFGQWALKNSHLEEGETTFRKYLEEIHKDKPKQEPAKPKKTRHYYGFRYYSGRNCTWSDSNLPAGCVVVFKSLKDRKKWLNEERLSAPCGCGGGERVAITRKKALKLGEGKLFAHDDEYQNNRWYYDSSDIADASIYGESEV